MEDLLHSRNMSMNAYLVSEDTIRVVGHLADDRPDESHTHLGGLIPPGTLHGMSAELDITLPGLTIAAARAKMTTIPAPACAEAGPTVEALVGLSVRAGTTREIMRSLGGERSCAHLRSLLVVMTQVAVQAAGAVAQRRLGTVGNSAVAVNTCIALREGGQIASVLSKPAGDGANGARRNR